MTVALLGRRDASEAALDAAFRASLPAATERMVGHAPP
jgi:hypothetical protein